MMETLGLAANEDAARKMTEYNAMLMAMNKKVNLTGIKDGEESLIKNIYDSMTVYDPAYFPQNGRVLDLGTGAGFPGVPLAILRPDMYVVLVDSIQKKLTFIEDACRELGIKNVKCVHIRAEEGGRRRKTRESFDVVTARAVKAMPVISEWAMPFVKVGGIFCAMKGPGAGEEAAAAANAAGLLGGSPAAVQTYTLPGELERAVVTVKKISQTSAKYPRASAKITKQPL